MTVSAISKPGPREIPGGAPLDRVLRALNHPVRRQILRALVDSTGSATTISQQIGIDLSVVSYHLSQVLARECDIVEVVDTVPRRGAIEKFYRLKFHALSDHDPGEAVGGNGSARRMSFEECLIVAVSALDPDEEFNARLQDAVEASRAAAS